MESSEDDAGTAASASRRASAREKDIGRAEDVNATSSFQQESSEAQISCETPAMSEDNFDGDSVRSHSPQDVNTSTEAILDMIDEIVDGPGAPKRLSNTTENVDITAETEKSNDPDPPDRNQEPSNIEISDEQQQSSIVSPAASAKSEIICNAIIPDQSCVESKPQVDAFVESVNIDSAVSPQASSSVVETSETTTLPGDSAVSCAGPSEPSGCPLPNIPSSNVVESGENVTDSNEHQTERTIKCVTSSDNRDNVIVENAESTSSDSSVSEGKNVSHEPETRSPLRRRLIRPAPSDRRPDSTVSSTVDSQSEVQATNQASGESVTKDVSSSSDAVPPVHGNVKSEEIRNVSEISVCKAETSMSPPKKIKLIRPKITPVSIQRDNTPDVQVSPTDKEQCQSTSSESIPTPVLPSTESEAPISPPKPQVDSCKVPNLNQADLPISVAEDIQDKLENIQDKHEDNKLEIVQNKPAIVQVTPEIVEAKSEIIEAKSEITEAKTEIQDKPEVIQTEAESVQAKPESIEDKPEIIQENPEIIQEKTEIIQEKPENIEKRPEDIQNKTQENTDSAHDNTSLPKASLIQKDIKETEEQKRVPPIKLCLNTSESAESLKTEVKSNSEELNTSSIHNESEVKQVPKLTIKLINKQDEIKSPIPKLTIKPLRPPTDEDISDNINSTEQVPCVTKINIKPIVKPTEKVNDTKDENESSDNEEKIPSVTKINIKPIVKPSEKELDEPMKSYDDQPSKSSCNEIPSVTKLNIKPIPKPDKTVESSIRQSTEEDLNDNSQDIPCVTKINIKPIPRPPEKINDIHRKSSSSEISESEYSENDETTSTSDQASASDHGPSDVVPKVTIKLGKPGSQCEGQFYTEPNIPKLTIKGLQHSEKDDESKLTLVISQPEDKQQEKIPKLTIKTVTKSEGQPLSPKLTIKPLKPPENVNKESGADHTESSQIPKLKISTESFSSSSDIKENFHVPKITIKPVTRSDNDSPSKTPKKSISTCDSSENIPVVTKLNIKPVLKPTDCAESSESLEDKVPVVSKLNIKPIVKPKDNEVDSSIENVPKITKLNIKPVKNPEEKSSEEKDCDELKADIGENSIPVVTKINIKPIVKPIEEDNLKDSENQSSETGNSSDENTDHIPVVTKLNIKPIIKPTNTEQSAKSSAAEENIPVVTKLNIKPIIKPDENISPSSPKKENLKMDLRSSGIPVITKLNIKPVVKPEECEQHKSKDSEESSVKNPPLVMKINMKSVIDTCISDSLNSSEKKVNNIGDSNVYNHVNENVFISSKSNAKLVNKSSNVDNSETTLPDSSKLSEEKESIPAATENLKIRSGQISSCQSEVIVNTPKQNCVPDSSAKTNSEVVSTKPEVSKGISANEILKPMLSPKESTQVLKPDSLVTVAAVESIKLDKLKSLDDKSIESVTNTKPIDHVETMLAPSKQKISSVQNCTLLKKLLEPKKDVLDKRLEGIKVNASTDEGTLESTQTISKEINCEPVHEPPSIVKVNSKEASHEVTNDDKNQISSEMNDRSSPATNKLEAVQNIHKDSKSNEHLTKPLEIHISEKVNQNQSSGQDSPRIILKINKTDHGASAKIITEEVKRPDTPQQNYFSENTQEVNDKQALKKNTVNSRRKPATETTPSVPMGKRLRSSRIVQSAEKAPIVKKNAGKRPSTTETSPTLNQEPELSALESKRLKLGQLLSNKSLTVTTVKITPASISPTKIIENKQGKPVNHTILNNENCSKNGNSKLHNILSNLQAKQMQTLPFNDVNCSDKNHTITSELESNTSTGSSDVVEIVPMENSHPEVQEMIINENSDFRDYNMVSEELSQDPLEVDNNKTVSDSMNESIDIPKAVELTPQPRKRGRPRKLPVSEGAKPVALPIPALEERPQRSLRLSRDRPAILAKPRGRGRGRGRRPMSENTPTQDPGSDTEETNDERPTEVIDPTSSRIKLPRMTEALDKMPSVCTTPLSSRRRNSSSSELKLFGETAELKVVLDSTLPKMEESFMKSPEYLGGRGSRGRGSRGGRGRTPGTPGRTPRAGRGRGRGGGRGAMYMKETMGIYGRVCGPATTTVQLFEEETCMMDDNATPAKPSHLLDEDSQSSVKSSTNESSKMKKSKFADLFDSNKVWTASDVKEYTWPPPDKANVEHQVMMIQEQVAMFLNVKSFKRRYPELKRRTIVGEERDYVLSRGLVTEALCDLGITAVDASEVLDIMLSDYPHKYEEYRTYQRDKQLAEASAEDVEETKPEERPDKIEMKVEMKPAEQKPEVPKIDPEKTRQDMAAAAIASASEWNARVNSLRRPACVDLQSLTIHRRRPPPTAPPPVHVKPPAGFYPHALLPGQYQHTYRVYTPEQLRYFPLNTALVAAAGPASPSASSSESEPDWADPRSSSSDDSTRHSLPNKRKKLTKTKRSSQTDGGVSKEEPKEAEVEVCRVCKLRLEANRKYTHERFLVCANCNAKLHPSCVELSADTIRKCREYAWQCAECKSCCACRQPADDDKMLFCDLCDRGFHIYCVGIDSVPQGRWHCVECAICKSCGARDPGGPGAGGPATPAPGTPAQGSLTPANGAEWHHQTRRGPGGHKMYSHSLCTPCARAYRIGRYCPLCERSFIGPKGTMQLVICKLCDRQLHQECVRQTVSALNVLDYTCGECRRGGITSRAAAVRLAPRTIATLFMAKRRFNKYAHRQYMQSRLQGQPKGSLASENSNDVADEPAERADDSASEGDAADAGDASDPLEGAAAAARDEAAAAVASLRMDFGD